jgi:hypothetical protein
MNDPLAAEVSRRGFLAGAALALAATPDSPELGKMFNSDSNAEAEVA